MPSYSDTATIRQALQEYFDFYHFAGGGYTDKWFRIKFGRPFTLVLPNIKARVDAVKLHDVHHVLTEFNADLCGEAEIGAWEIATSCGKYYVAWLLNLGSMAYGIIFWPGRIYKAFMWGRRCSSLYTSNLYSYDEKLFGATVGEVRNAFGLGKTENTRRVSDNFLFGFIYSFLVLAMLSVIAVVVLLVAYIWKRLVA